MDDKNKKELRAEIFKQALDRAGVPEWGRGAAIVKKTGCSPASAQAWIRGSLPSEGERIVELCDLYSIDLYLWITLESRGDTQISDSMVEAIVYVKHFEEQTSFMLTPEQFAHMCLMYLDTEKRDGLASVAEVLSQKDDASITSK
jgi:hypothetical protein